MTVGGATSCANGKLTLTIGSNADTKFKSEFEALVVPSITKVSPVHTMEQIHEWNHIHGLKLADPTHMKPGNIDILMGVEPYAQIFLPESKHGGKDQPMAHKTRLGWVLLGPTPALKPAAELAVCNMVASEEGLDSQRNSGQ